MGLDIEVGNIGKFNHRRRILQSGNLLDIGRLGINAVIAVSDYHYIVPGAEIKVSKRNAKSISGIEIFDRNIC